MDLSSFKLEFVSTLWQISARQYLPESVLNQFRAHRCVVSVFYNPHNQIFFASFHANNLQEAQMLRDWILEDVIFPDEQFTCDWDDELMKAVHRHFNWKSWTLFDDEKPHSPTGTFGWLGGLSSDDDDKDGETAA